MTLKADELLAEVQRLKERPTCGACRRGFLRALDITAGQLDVRCSSPACAFRRQYALPPLEKKILYLDTSVVSNIARARRPLFARLHEALREASYKNVIMCVVSSIAVSEIELARDGDRILEVGRELGTARVNHQVEVQDAQFWRAFGRFRQNEAAVRETRPPREDALHDDLNAWPGVLSFRSRVPTRPPEIERRREHKAESRDTLQRYYAKYAAENTDYEQVAARETEGFCARARSDAWLTRRMEFALETQDGHSSAIASEIVSEFFGSEHAKLLPSAVINGRLHAALALAFRSDKPRLPDDGDVYDIDHLSTYLPYVDVFATDQFMAGVANQGNVRLASEYGTVVQGLGERQVETFIQFLSELTAGSPVADLASAIYDAIAAGGFLQDLVSFARGMYPRDP